MGARIFATGSPAAQLISILFRAPGPDGDDRTLAALVPVGTAGMEIADTWDALGMRASASNDVVFRDCFISEAGVTDFGPWGELSRLWLAGLISNHLGLVAAFLGIAETARDHAIELVTTRRKGQSNHTLAERAGVRHLVAENEIDLSASRALLSRTALLVDAYFQTPADPDEPLERLHALHKELQSTKWFVTRKAIDIVDRALTLSGGSGYLTGSPLARLYRDVRAGPFMQPFSPNEVFDYIGKVAVGLDPTLEE
jgi:alkylation response protein AidB-like acyl-CoA dehydrogenase